MWVCCGLCVWGGREGWHNLTHPNSPQLDSQPRTNPHNHSDMNKKAIVLLSGGLDSILATKLMLEQGVEVVALNFMAKLCMCGAKKTGESAAQTASRMLGVTLKTIDFTKDFIEIVKNPEYGHGANINPCIDCKIYMLRRAKELMGQAGASFVVTGEVLGERPMSQRKDALDIIQRQAGLKGFLLRPLCAKLLDPTIPETEGLVDREKLLDIRGRSRKPQMALAKKFGIDKYPTPAGGCLLTDPGFARRVKDAIKYNEFDEERIALLSVGRHFRLSDKNKLIIGRDDKENILLESLKVKGDIIFNMADCPGPYAILTGLPDEAMIKTAASLVAYHTKLRNVTTAKITYWVEGTDSTLSLQVVPAALKDVEGCRL